MTVRLRRRHLIKAAATVLVLSLVALLFYFVFPAVRLQCLYIADDLGESDIVVHYFSDSDRAVIHAATDRLAARAPKSLPSLTRGLEHSDSRVRTMSAFTLGRIGREAYETVRALTAHRDSDPNEVMRSTCAKALAKIRRDDPVLLDELTATLEHGSLDARLRAIDALCQLWQLGRVEAPRILERALKDESTRVREAAEEALGLDD
jgi:HEAT repeat protein